jgi:hypothetical protein
MPVEVKSLVDEVGIMEIVDELGQFFHQATYVFRSFLPDAFEQNKYLHDQVSELCRDVAAKDKAINALNAGVLTLEAERKRLLTRIEDLECGITKGAAGKQLSLFQSEGVEAGGTNA